ncbi:MAG: hypothetical protein UY28_C0005G0016 [Candidatus Amesbacteria bacterium GW2011_GWB1_48_13]|uniref:Putative membrane protein insertion efficiency factor n=1 Tax=Candidatus Amesbacteria bacterium GW2011_GWB1_48_13 TaxID=1618362 RepID=A0A0G1UW14_9BACT|nr:MAG: hypothetical protein UY28_C0005G0016 [Candidatus Amesbacteria bacterium GW2011_GWB1_48_13]
MKSLALLLIKFYQKYLSFDTGLLRLVIPGAAACRFQPRCSEYTYQAVSKYGILHGSVLGLKRILKCRPGHPGGSDPLT